MDFAYIALVVVFWLLLVGMARVFDRQIVQTELVLHRRQLGIGRVAQRDPDEAIRPADILADIGNRDVGELLSVLVGDAVDQHGVPRTRPRSANAAHAL